MGVKEKRLTIPATLEKVEEACEFVSNFAGDLGMSDDAVYHCYLSVEEVCTNVIEHGYKYKGDDQVIEVVCQPQSDHLRIVIIDDAVRFDPMVLNDPDPSAPLLDRGDGGWGVFFVKKFMNSVDYRYEKNRNQLILKKHF
jgi:serine/threonine-protein kinase RsbW